MAWNEPGGSGNGRDPWGNGGKNQGPPDLDEVVRNLRNKIGGLFGGSGGSSSSSDDNSGGSGMGLLIILALVGWLVIDASYVVEPAERGVVLRFGKYVDSLQPGFNIRFPRPIEKVYKIDVDAVRTIEIGLSNDVSYMLTKDQNIVDVRFNIQYRIKDPRAYLFNDAAPELSLKHATESAVREVVGKNQMDFVIKDGREQVGAKAGELVQQIVDSYRTGILITQFNMQKAKEPEEVREAFADAVKAEADEERYKNEAEAYQQEVLGRAKGTVQRTLQDAGAYQARVIESATGEADRFSKLLTEYEKAPVVTRERLYIETMESVLSSSTKIMTDTEGGGNNLLYLPLDQIMKQTQSNNSKADATRWSPGKERTPISSSSGRVISPRSRGDR